MHGYFPRSTQILQLLLYCTLLLGSVRLSFAQTPLRIFEPVGMSDKGRQFYASVTQDVLTDRLGRVWYSTLGSGVIRYDGYNYRKFQYDRLDTTTISGNRVTRLYEDAEDNIWTICFDGVDRLNIRTGRFSRFGMPPGVKRVYAIAQYTAAVFLIGTNAGIWELDAISKKFTPWAQTEGNTVYLFHQDAVGQWRAASANGLCMVFPDQKRCDVVPVLAPDAPEPLWFNKIFQNSSGQLWVNSAEGLLQYLPEKQQFIYAGLPDSMRHYQFAGMAEAPDGSLWLGGNKGLVHWNSATGFTEHFYANGKWQHILPEYVSNMSLDRLGNLWMGVRIGLLKTNIFTPNYQLYQVQNGRDLPVNMVYWSAKDERGGMLMFNGNTLHYATQLGKKPDVVPLPPGKNLLPFSNHVARTPDDKVRVSWLQGGLGEWNPVLKKFGVALPDTSFGGEPIQGQFYDPTDPDLLWIGTARGLWRVNQKTGKKKCFVPIPFLQQNTTVVEVTAAGDDGLWCQLFGGIGYFDKVTEQFTMIDQHVVSRDSLVTSEILDIISDRNQALWVAGMGGLSKIEKTTQGHFRSTAFDVGDGLPDNSPHSLEIDGEGYIWVGFNSAFLVRIHPASHQMMYYDLMNSVLSRPHIRKSLSRSEAGLFYDFSQDGLIVFDPLHIRRDTNPPAIVLTEIVVNNTPLPIQAEYTREIILNPDENAVAFEFVGIFMNSPYAIQYQYRLMGYDTGWVNCPNDLRRAGYTNLVPGRYRFLVRAANPDGVWSKDTELIQVVINPAFYQTSWFRFLILIVISAIIYGVLYNRVQQRQLREDKVIAEQSARYKSQFLANMSHEIRTPMNAILGLSRLLDESKLDTRQKKYLQAIRYSSEDLLRIVNDILDYSKIESGQFTFHPAPFDLQEMLHHHIEQPFLFRATEKGIGFRLERDKETPVALMGDAVRLTQILTNLVGNAIKFTDKGNVVLQVICLNKDTESAHIQFVVTDTGPGIPTDQIEQVFERFSQVNTGGDTDKGGTGLGLSIAKQLVEQQGGHILLESEAGKGTTVSFDLLFPVVETPPGLAGQAPQQTRTGLLNTRILLVEDTYFNQLLATELLTSRIEGVKIDIAENGQVALEKLQTNTYDLVLMDVKMPVMDGLEATRRIRSMPGDAAYRTIPIVGLTANAVPDELEKCRQAGMDYWVTKPVQADELLAILEKAMHKYD